MRFLILLPLFFSLPAFTQDYARFIAQNVPGGWMRLVDSTGREIIPPRYHHLHVYHHNFIVVNRFGFSGLFDSTGRQRTPLIFRQIIPCRDGSFWASEWDAEFPFYKCDTHGRRTSDEMVGYIEALWNGHFFRETWGEKLRYYDADGRPFLPEKKFYGEYDGESGYYFPDLPQGCFLTGTNERIGVYSFDSERVIPEKYRSIYFQENHYIAVSEEQVDFYDSNFELKNSVISRGGCFQFHGNYFLVGCYGHGRVRKLLPDGREYSGDETGLKNQKAIDNNDSEEADKPGRWMDYYQLFLIHQNGKYGYLDPAGNMIIEPLYDHPGILFDPELIMLRKDGMWGLADRKGRVVLPVEFSGLKNCGWGVVAETAGQPTRIFNRQGKLLSVLPPGNEYVAIRGGKLLLKTDSLWNLVDSTLTVTEALGFEKVESMHHFGWRAEKGGQQAIFDYEFNQILPFEYERIGQDNRGFGPLFFFKNGVCTVVDGDLKPIFSVRADELELMNNGFCKIRRGGTTLLYDRKTGLERVVEFEYVQLIADNKLIVLKTAEGLRLLDRNLRELPLPYPLEWPQSDEEGYSRSGGGYLVMAKDGKEGIISATGEIVLPFENRWVHVFANRNYIAFSNDNFEEGERGFLFLNNRRQVSGEEVTGYDLPFFLLLKNGEGLQVIRCKTGEALPGDFSAVQTFDDKSFFALKNKAGLWAVFDTSGRQTTAFEFEDIESSPVSPGFYSFYKNEKWHWSNLSTGLDLPPGWRVGYFDKNNDLLYVRNPAGKCGLMNSKGEMLLEPDFDDLGVLPRGHSIAKKDGKFGLIGPDGSFLQPLEYDLMDAGDHGSRVLVVGSGGKYWFIGFDGKRVGEAEYEFAEGFYAGLAAVRKNGRWGFVDETGREVIPLDFDYADRFLAADFERFARQDPRLPPMAAGTFADREALVMKDGQCFWIDEKGKKLRDYQASNDLTHFQRQLHSNRSDPYSSECLVLDPQNRLVLWFSDCALETTQRGLIGIVKGRLYGLMDYGGHVFLSPEFSHIDFSEFEENDLARFSLDKKWGFLDRQGRVAISPIYDRAYGFSRETGLAQVMQNGKTFKIDKTGNCVEDCP